MTWIAHHGILGQKWGVRRYQNPDGSLTAAGKRKYSKYSSNDTVFLSGKVGYDEPIAKPIQDEVDKIMSAKSKVIIGDAPGADTRLQQYLSDKDYRNVVVYTTDGNARNNVGNWVVQKIDGNRFQDERSIRRQKDIAMTKDSTRALAIMPEDDRPDSAMSLNIQRLQDSGKFSRIYDYKQNKWINR